jgi:hypothetical protein
MQTHNEHSIDKFTVTLNVSPEINKDQVCTHITDEKDELLKLINEIFDDSECRYFFCNKLSKAF